MGVEAEALLLASVGRLDNFKPEFARLKSHPGAIPYQYVMEWRIGKTIAAIPIRDALYPPIHHCLSVMLD